MTEVALDAVTAESTLRLHELRMREAETGAGAPEEWVVGRFDTGEFVRMPEIGVHAIRLLARGLTVGEVGDRLHTSYGRDFDVRAFAATLCQLGFAAELDGRTLAGATPRQPTLRRLRPRHVRWTLSPVTWWLLPAVIVAGLVAAVLNPGAVPHSGDLVWSDHVGLVLAGNAAMAWSLILLHELAHLAVARAAGAPAWMSLGTRLQFLAAQTDVSSLWAVPRMVRVAAYLAGLALDLTFSATAMMVLAIAEPSGVLHDLLSVLTLGAVLGVATQLMVFTRTDLYFVMLELSGCGNLYATGASYLRYLLSGRRRPNPTDGLPARQRHWIRCYTLVQAAGTLICLASYTFVALPFLIELIRRSVGLLFASESAVGVLNAVLVLSIVTTMQVLWARAWVRRHGRRVARLLRRRAT